MSVVLVLLAVPDVEVVVDELPVVEVVPVVPVVPVEPAAALGPGLDPEGVDGDGALPGADPVPPEAPVPDPLLPEPLASPWLPVASPVPELPPDDGPASPPLADTVYVEPELDDAPDPDEPEETPPLPPRPPPGTPLN